MRTGQGGSKHDGPGPAFDRSNHRRCRPCVNDPYAPRRASAWVGGHERGSVTAEVAVVLPALVILLALLLGTAHVGAVQLRIEEAARAGAREAMRGESNESVEQTVQRLAGSSAATTVTSGAGWTTVEVLATVDGPVVALLGLELRATATGRVDRGG